MNEGMLASEAFNPRKYFEDAVIKAMLAANQVDESSKDGGDTERLTQEARAYAVPHLETLLGEELDKGPEDLTREEIDAWLKKQAKGIERVADARRGVAEANKVAAINEKTGLVSGVAHDESGARAIAQDEARSNTQRPG